MGNSWETFRQTDFVQKHPQPRLRPHCKFSSRIEKSRVFRINNHHSEQTLTHTNLKKKNSIKLAWWSETLAFGSRDSELASENKFDHKSLAVFSKRRPKRVTNYHSSLAISQHSLLWKRKLQLTQSRWVPYCCCESYAAVSIVCK